MAAMDEVIAQVDVERPWLTPNAQQLDGQTLAAW